MRSKGFARRLMLALALLTPQPLLLMDEPFDGFDLRQTRGGGLEPIGELLQCQPPFLTRIANPFSQPELFVAQQVRAIDRHPCPPYLTPRGPTPAAYSRLAALAAG